MVPGLKEPRTADDFHPARRTPPHRDLMAAAGGVPLGSFLLHPGAFTPSNIDDLTRGEGGAEQREGAAMLATHLYCTCYE